MNPELIAAVKERLSLGRSEEMIREELTQAGYADEVITEVLAVVRETPPIAIPAVGGLVLPSGTELFERGVTFARRYYELLFFLAIPSLVALGVGYVGAVPSWVAPVVSIVAFVVYLFVVIATLRILTIDDGTRTVSLSEVWPWASKHVWGLLWVMLLSGLVVWGGLMLFLIPGIIVSFAIYFAQYVYVQEGLHGMNALMRSRELTKGRLWPLAKRLLVVVALFFLIMIGLGIVASLLSVAGGIESVEEVSDGVVMNILMELLNAFSTLVMLKIGADLYATFSHDRPATETVPTEGRGKYIALSIIGILFIPLLLIATFLSGGFESLEYAPEELRGEFQENAMFSNEEAKQRALELRHQ